MSKLKSIANPVPLSKSGGWDEAIHEAEAMIAESEAMIAESRRRIGELESALRSFRKLRDKGMPFPGKATAYASTHN